MVQTTPAQVRERIQLIYFKDWATQITDYITQEDRDVFWRYKDKSLTNESAFRYITPPLEKGDMSSYLLNNQNNNKNQMQSGSIIKKQESSA